MQYVDGSVPPDSHGKFLGHFPECSRASWRLTLKYVGTPFAISESGVVSVAVYCSPGNYSFSTVLNVSPLSKTAGSFLLYLICSPASRRGGRKVLHSISSRRNSSCKLLQNGAILPHAFPCLAEACHFFSSCTSVLWSRLSAVEALGGQPVSHYSGITKPYPGHEYGVIQALMPP